MGVNEIHDGRDTLLTQRMENIRKVQKREGEAGGGQQFQQLFEFAENKEREENGDKEKQAEAPMPAAPPRVITPEDIEKVKKRNELSPGQIIDVEA